MSFEEWSNKKRKAEQERINNSRSVLGGKTTFSEWSNNKIIDRIDQDYLDAFVTDANSFIGSAEKTYNGITWGNASSTFNSQYNLWSDLDTRAYNISKWLERNKSNLDEETYKSLSESLKTISSNTSSIMDGFGEYKNYYSQWKTEEDYNKAVEAQKEYEGMMSYNLAAGKKEIEELEKAKTALEWTKKSLSELKSETDALELSLKKVYNKDDEAKLKANKERIATTEKNLEEALAKYGGESGLNALLSEKNQYYTLAERVQSAEKIKTDAINNPDFDKYVKAMPLTQEEWLSNWDKNIEDAAVGEYEDGVKKYLAENNLQYRALKYMKPDEYKIYSYYIMKDAKNARDNGTENTYELSNKYLESIEETLNARLGEYMYSRVDDNLFLEYCFAAQAGIEQYSSGIRNLFSGEDYIPVTATEYASSMIREDLADTGFKLPDWLGGASISQVGYDLVNTTANMLPTMIVSQVPVVGTALGAVSTGLSSAGNKKTEMLREGYSQTEATTTGVLTGIAESGLQYAIGGITSLGGKASGSAISAVSSKVNNGVARAAIKIGGNMAAEGLEESLQSILEPYFKSIATGQDVEDIDWEEVAYSGLLGMATAGILEGPSTIAGEVGTYKAGKNIKADTDALNRLTKLGSTMSADSVAYKLAGKIDENTGAYTIGRLLNEVGASLSEANISDIVKSLERKGVRPQDAQTMAKWLSKVVEGETFSNKQVAAIENNDVLATTLVDVLLNKNSTVWQRMNGYEELRKLANSKASAKNPTADKTKATPVTENPTTEEIATEGKIEASEDVETKIVGKDVKVKDIASIKNGEVKLLLDNGETINARDVGFANEDEGLIYEAVADMNIDKARDFIQGFTASKNAPLATPQTAESYMLGFNEAYGYGRYGIPEEVLDRDGKYSKSLSGGQKKIAYNRGAIDAELSVGSAQEKVNNAVANAEPNKSNANGRVTYDKGIRGTLAKGSKEAESVKLIEFFNTHFSHAKVRIYASYVDENGRRVFRDTDGKIKSAPNGMYMPDGSIALDLNSGENGEGLVLYSFSHELTHMAKRLSPEKYKAYADFLFKHYGENQSVEQLIAYEINFAKKKGRKLSREDAYDEAVARASERMLVDVLNGTAQSKLAELNTKHKDIFEKIKEFFAKLIESIKNWYNDTPSWSDSANIVHDMQNVAEQLQTMWLDMVTDAGRVNSALGGDTTSLLKSNNLVELDTSTESIAPTMNSERTWTASEYVTERENTAKEISKALGVSLETAYKYIDDINSVARLIADDRARLDYEPNLDDKATVLKPNSEYKFSVDMSTLCAKRLLFTGTFDAIQRALPNMVFDSEDIVSLREMMQKRGYEVACGICYVESTRREIGQITQDFINSYKESQKTGKPITRLNSEGKVVELKKTKEQKETTADKSTDKYFAEKDYTPTLADLNTTDIDLVKRDHPLVYEAYLNFMNARGQAKPKLLETRAEYKGEILKHFKAKSAVTARNNSGGLRLQSFSDFEVPHLIDMMQVVMDMSRVGLKSQAYTKVPAFAEVFGDTGVKINLSLIAKGDGLDANGNLIFDDVEGINHKEAFKLRDKYSKNVGTILVGKTDAHIIAAMADPRIDYIIPFHKSSWKESLYDALGLTGYENYTDFQNEKPIDKDRKIKNYDPSEYWDFSKSGDENAQIYLQKCREDGRIPKFPQFQGYPGYWKLLIDFKMYDNNGVGSPQEVVKPTFNTEASERILREYKGGHRSFPVAKDVVEDFVKEHKDNVKYSDRDSSYSDRYSYEELTSKPDMKVALVDDSVKYNRADIVYHALKNAASVGYTNENGNAVVHVDDIDTDVIVPKRSLVHGLDRRIKTQAPVFMKIGEVLKNSIRINELIPRADEVKNSYVLIGAARNQDGHLYVTSFVVNKYSNEITEIDVLYSANAKKESAAFLPKITDKSATPTDSAISIAHLLDYVNRYFPDILPESVLRHYGHEARPEGKIGDSALYSDRDSYAPTFYSQMGKVINEIKMDKIGAASLVNYLKGKGIKHDEIKWSGIEAWLEGKKSVTKAELQEFLAGSQLQIEEQMSGLNQEVYDELDALWKQHAGVSLSETFSDDFDLPLTADNMAEVFDDMEREGYDVPSIEVQNRMLELAKKAGNEGRWSKYKLAGGTNYRELVFVMPNSTYSNNAMRAHWGEDAEGVLAHARIQDMTTTDGKKMLFIEELQSDWHNEGAKDGYADDSEYARIEKLKAKAEEAFFRLEDYSVEVTGLAGEWETIEKTEKGAKLLREYNEAKAEAVKAGNAFFKKIPDAPFRTTYHEYVLKRLLRMAAEEGYDSLGWTPSDIQSKRWSDEFAEGYRIEYDQDIPKFLRKYGKKWGATVGKAALAKEAVEGRERILKETELENVKRDLERAKRELARKYDSYERAVLQRSIDSMEKTVANLEEELSASLSVWSMDITDSMTESVLYEGQVMYSERVTDKKTLNFLENQEHITTYKSFVEIDGKLYSPMATKVKGDDGKYRLTNPSELGVWQQAEEKPDSIPKFNKSGYGYYVLKKDDGGSVTAAYNPYEHSSNLVLNDQFESAYQRPNLVTVECIIPKSEMTSGYKAKYAKDSTGYLDWKSGIVAGKLKGNKRKVYLSRWLKPVRIVSDAEVASMYKDILGTNISVPFNVVPPQLLTELEKVGVKIDYEGSPGYQYRQSKKKTDDSTMYSERTDDSVSNRSLLANALESVAQNEIEKNKLKEYKSKIDIIDAEQRKLADLRAKIKELSFAKGTRDTEQIKKLQSEATISANRIHTYDRQLLNLESTTALKNVLAREKEMARKREAQKGREALAKQREREAEKTRTLLNRAAESRKKGIEGRKKTEMRHKIKDIVSDLNKLLLNPTKDQHVPIGLQLPVAQALAVVNMDTIGAEQHLKRLQDELMKAKTPEKAQEIAKKMEYYQDIGGRIDARLTALKTAYDNIVNSEDPLVANSHDEVISQMIAKVQDDVGSTPIRDMSLSQLEEVYDLFKAVLTTIRNANKSFKGAQKERYDTLASRVMEEIDTLGIKRRPLPRNENGKEKGGLRKGKESFAWNNQKPIYAFEHIGSNTLTGLYKNVRAGEDTWAQDIQEAREFFISACKKYGYTSWDLSETFTFKSTTGKEFEISLDMIMSLYAYSKRGKQAVDHISHGGIVLDDGTGNATSYKISKETLSEIIAKVTSNTELKAFVDEMQEYLSSVMGEKGNEVALELYGIKLFKEKFYFPLKSSPIYMAKSREQDQTKGEVKIKNYGITKETKEGAKNPIILSSFVDVWANHVNEMSMYHAFVLPMEDFYRVFNYHTPYTEETEAVRGYIQNAYGDSAVSYVDQLLKDLNGGAVSDPREGLAKGLMTKFKKAKTMLSLSVIVQQPTSVVRAMALVDAKYFVGKPSMSKHGETWAEVKKYAPVAVIKEMGYFDTNMGRSATDYITGQEYHGIKDKAKALVKDGNYRDEAFSKLPALADELAWCSIWHAVKREVVHTHPNLTPNSEAFLKVVGERFTEVITRTQVYDSTLSRSGWMRSKSGLVNMWTAFLGEPTTSINMLGNAILNIKRGNKKVGAKAIGGIVGAIVFNAALVSLVYAMRDDDEDETFIEKYTSRFSTELLEGFNPLTYIPFIKDVWSITQGYDVERTDMSLISDLWSSFEKVITVLAEDTEDMDEEELEEHKKEIATSLLSIVGSISSLTGLPVENISRDIKGIINSIGTISKDTTERDTSWSSLGDEVWEDVKNSIPVVGKLPDESKSDKLYDAIISGDDAYRERLESAYDTESKLNSALRKALRDNDPRIKEAALARNNGNTAEYMRIAKEIIAEGNFSQDNIVAAINAEINALNKGESTTTSSNGDKEESIFKMDDYYAALIGRDEATAYTVKEDIIDTAIANGKDRDEAEESFNSSFTSHLREQYELGEISDYEAQRMLINYGGKTEEQAYSKVQYWAFKEDYPEYDDLSESAVTKYYEEIEPSGISVSVYYDYSMQSAKCKGTDSDGDGRADSGTKKREIMQVINSLPISTAQKDALYFANGWARSTLWEAPWH